MASSNEDILRSLSTAVISIHATELCSQHGDTSACDAPADASASHGISILVPYAGKGTWSVQLARHVSGIKKIVVGNSLVEVVDGIRSLVAREGVSDVVSAVCDTPTLLMYRHHKHSDRFDVVDLDVDDVVSHIDTAVQCVRDGGILLVTCRDVDIAATDACYARYGAVALPSDCAAEVALRVVLKCVESHANRHGRYVQPLICVSLEDSCVKVCVKVSTSPVVCKQTLSKLSMVYHCTGCRTLTPQPLGLAERHPDQKNRFKFSLPRGQPVGLRCEHCQAAYKMAGPLWSGPIHCPALLARLANCSATAESQQFQQLVAVVTAELDNVCFHYSLQALRRTLPTEPAITLDDLRSALHEYRVSAFHASADSLQTDAPASAVWAAVVRWGQQQHVTQLPTHQAGTNIREHACSMNSGAA